MKALTARLVLSTLAMLVAVAALTWWVLLDAARGYSDELVQRWSTSIAMYMNAQAPLIVDGRLNGPALERLGAQAMVVNPVAEVYVLDPQGRILGSTAGRAPAAGSAVSLRPIQAFLGGADQGPIYGDNPREPGQASVFSAARIGTTDTQGYVYVVLGGERKQGLTATIAGSHILQAALLTVLAILGAMGLAAWLITTRLTGPLHRLHGGLQSLATRLALPPSQARAVSVGDIGALQTVFDATAAELDRLVTALRTTDRVRRELFANVSHDFRTPLTAMRGYLETLQSSAESLSAAEQRNLLDIAVRHCARLGRLTDQLFALARLDLGQGTLRLETVAIGELLQDIVQKFQLQGQRQGVRVQLEVDHLAAPVVADIGLLENVVENLLDNALRHTPRGGQVTARVRAAAGTVTVAITDTGAGIAALDLTRIVQPFERGPGGRTGLGLAIVQRILDLHGSRLRLTSETGAGTIAEFELSAAPAAGSAPVAPALTDSPVSRSREDSVTG